MRLAAVVAMVLLWATNGAAQRDFSKVVIQATHVAGPVHMLEGSGGNIGVSAGPDGVLLVDDQFAPLADRIKEALGQLGSDRPAFVLNTHHHGDHTGGNEVFGRDGTIIAHENVRKRLKAPKADSTFLPEDAIPVITFDQSVTVHFNGEAIRVLHMPQGHTDGDAVVFFAGSNVVHMGDLFFAGRFPYIDMGSGGTPQGYRAAAQHVLSEVPDDVKIIPGHGPLSTKKDLKAFLRMIDETMALVQIRIDSGMTLDEIKKVGLPEEWAAWGGGFISADRWIETLYRGIVPEGTSREGGR